jgi:hypothetical protein
LTRTDALADHFASPWKASESGVYTDYMAHLKPVNKRVFHLVYGRSIHSGGDGHEGSNHLNQQILIVAKDLFEITKQFVVRINDLTLRESGEVALVNAQKEATLAAEHYKIENPFV